MSDIYGQKVPQSVTSQTADLYHRLVSCLVLLLVELVI